MRIEKRVLLLLILIVFSFSSISYGEYYPDREVLYGSDNEETGKVKVYKRTAGSNNRSLDITLSVNGFWISQYIVSSGNKIYFLACKKKSKKSNFRLYEYDMKTKEYKLLYKMPSKYTDGYLTETYDNSVYMCLDAKKERYCLRYYIKSGKLKTIFDFGAYYKYKNFFVFEKAKENNGFFPVKYNKEFIVYNAKTGKKKTIFKGYAEGLSRTGKYLYYAVSTDGKGFEINKKTRYKIIRYDLTTGKKKTILKSVKFYEIEFITNRYVYHETWATSSDKYYRYDLIQKKNQRISEDAFEAAEDALEDGPDTEVSFVRLG